MAKVELSASLYAKMQELDGVVAAANNQKIVLLLDALGIQLSAAELALLLEWELILIVVADRQMAVQFNKLVAYVPNLKFVVAAEHDLFTVLQGRKGKRVWKAR